MKTWGRKGSGRNVERESISVPRETQFDGRFARVATLLSPISVGGSKRHPVTRLKAEKSASSFSIKIPNVPAAHSCRSDAVHSKRSNYSRLPSH